MSDLFKYLLNYEETWCKKMGYFNPYIDKFTTHLTNKMPFLALLIANIGLPNIPKTEFDLITFIKNYGLVWLAVYLSAWVMMRLLFPRWRFRGGEWMGKWPI